MLQLALVRSAGSVVEVKRTLALLNKLYAMFSHSPKRLGVLQATEEAVDGMSHKLVQPGETRWLSYDGSVAVVCSHYGALCLALEAIYADAGDLSCDAGGLLLQLRNGSTLFLLYLLNSLLQPLARLSKSLQSSDGYMPAAMSLVRATLHGLSAYDYKDLERKVNEAKVKIVNAGVHLAQDISVQECQQLSKRFVDAVVLNLENRFSDEVSQLCNIQHIFKEKTENPDVCSIARLTSIIFELRGHPYKTSPKKARFLTPPPPNPLLHLLLLLTSFYSF